MAASVAVPARCQAAAAPSAALSQQPLPAAPEFDLAAIHQNTTDQSSRSHIISSSRDSKFAAINVTLKSLVQWAWVFPRARVFGGPAWFDSARFNIEARADSSVDDQLQKLAASDAGRAEKQAMVRALLAGRFNLKVHLESRQMPIYALVLDKGGPKFKPSQVNGTTINQSSSSMRTEISVRGSDDTLALLADALARPLGRPVMNRTGLQGRYDLTLQFAPDDTGDARSGPPGKVAPEEDPGLPSIFTAIQEQLGLKLVPQKGSVPVLIVDQAEMPSEN